MANENYLKTFDCTMICTLLGLEFDRRGLQKLARRFDLMAVDDKKDHYAAYHKTHQACHSNGSLLMQKHLNKLFKTRYNLLSKQLAAVNSENQIELEAFCEEHLERKPAGLIWALLTADELTKQQLGVYYTHKLMLDAFQEQKPAVSHGCGGKCQCASTQLESKHVREQNKILLQQHNDMKKKLAATERELGAAGERLKEQERELQLQALRTVPDQEAKLKREIRMLKYELDTKNSRPVDEEEPVKIDEDPCCQRGERDLVVREKEACQCDENVVCRLDRLKIAVIGGLDRLVPRYRETIKRMGGKPSFHNGRCNGGTGGLKKMICSADVIIYITTINSHNAMHVVKAVCRKSGRELHMIRECSVKALERLLNERVAREIHCQQDEQETVCPANCLN